jgi:hypothetical protein
MTEPLRATESTYSGQFLEESWESDEPNATKTLTKQESDGIGDANVSKFEESGGLCEIPAAEYGFWLESRSSGSMDRANGTEIPRRGENNAERTRHQTSSEPYADAGLNASLDAAYAGVALIKNHDRRTGIDTEVFSASAQVGGQNEAQLGGLRLTKSGSWGEIDVETLTARAHGGAHNDDGSTGVNSGAGATLLGIEGTLNLEGGNSVTLGAAFSKGSMVSVGSRDVDKDGRNEACFKASLLSVTVGACIED